MRARSARFLVCDTCTHATLAPRPGPCRMCGGATREETPPGNLHDGWRCTCFQCAWTPC